MNLSLPKSVETWVKEQAVREGYVTASEYVRELLRKERLRMVREKIDAELLAAIESGQSTPMTKTDWEDIRREGRRRIAARRKGK